MECPFRVVIPTRQRHERLPYSIRTVLDQNFVNYEIIVWDNYDNQEQKML